MSISGYVPDQYQLTIVDTKGDLHEVASSDVVHDIKIYRNHYKVLTEIDVPCIVYQAVYRLEVTINTLAIEEFFEDVVAEDSVSLQLFETSLKDGSETKFKNWKIKKSTSSKVEVSREKCSATLCFALDSNYSSHRNQSFINVALKIQGIVLKYIVCDLGVVTNSSQISSDYKIICADQLQKTLKKSFWGKSNDCYGSLSTKVKRKRPTSVDELDSDELSEPNTLSASRESKSVKLQTIIQSLEECLKKAQAIDDVGDQDWRIANIFVELNSTVSKTIEFPQSIVPEHLLMIPPPPLPFDAEFDEFINFLNK